MESLSYRRRFSNSIQARICAPLMRSRRSANSGSSAATHSSSVASAREVRTDFSSAGPTFATKLLAGALSAQYAPQTELPFYSGSGNTGESCTSPPGEGCANEEVAFKKRDGVLPETTNGCQ